MPEHQYKAAIQGHFTISKDRQKIANYSARAYYDDYAIADKDANKDGRLGIKLNSLADFQQISQFTTLSSAIEDVPIPTSDDIQPPQPELTAIAGTGLRVGEAFPFAQRLAEKEIPEATSSIERTIEIDADRAAIDRGRGRSLPQLDRDASWEQILSIYHWFVTELNSLRTPSQFDLLQQENDRLQQQLANLAVENQALHQQLAAARQRLDAIAGMFGC